MAHCGLDLPAHSPGPVATQGGFAAAVENTAPSHLGVRSKALSVGLSNAYFKSPGLSSLFEGR